MLWELRPALVLATILLAGAASATPETRITGVASVVDGDTLDLGPVRIRLHGIDAPEASQECNATDGGSWRCGEAATARLEALADGKPAICIALDRDVYGRIIGVCEVDGVVVNEALMREGLAWAFRRYSEDYVGIEIDAQAAGLGVWQAYTQSPWDWRADGWGRACAALPEPCCPIKGNINRSGERIYHTPWSSSWANTVIDEAAGERWFCDEAEARAAGWREPRGR